MSLTVIGDVHGEFPRYIRKAVSLPYSVQLGDMGFDYAPLGVLNPEQHKFFGGNHDNYAKYFDVPHALGNYGLTTLGGVVFFYIRGAFSIDKAFRTEGMSWWRDEELSDEVFESALRTYRKCEPEIVITHDCPKSIADRIGEPAIVRGFGFDPDTFRTRTQDWLQKMFELHQPKRWIFGHFHKWWTQTVNGTEFQCLNELQSVEIDA